MISARSSSAASDTSGTRSWAPSRERPGAEGRTATLGLNAEHLLKRLEWTVIRRLDGLLHGDYRTFMRGTGLDLADLREYHHPDDVRHIDWNVTARLQVPHVRVFTEDREMSAWFLLDLSPSLDFGSGPQRKLGVTAEFVAVLARLLTRHGNRVGALLYGTGVDTVLAPRAGRRQVLHLLHSIQTRAVHRENAQGPTRLHELLQAASAAMRRRCCVFVVSDFISEPGWEQPLADMARRHDVVAVRVLDPMERELPDLGLIPMRDAETGEQLLVDTHDAGFRNRFARIAAQREAQLRQSLQSAGVDTLALATDDDLLNAIVRFADLRRRRYQLAAGRAGMPGHLRAARAESTAHA
jgi:uncharacterized protein (DUF58 family)